MHYRPISEKQKTISCSNRTHLKKLKHSSDFACFDFKIDKVFAKNIEENTISYC